ncbi:uncharacterized protein JCM15063_003203 [Sporobolomyces koalae]|uniref:uncharacterized protein n=1 Tax=Sporobolomyces koalae TaxID=500713 RepID=UPI00317838D8
MLQAAMYMSWKQSEEPTVSSLGKKTPLLHTAWFGGSFVCSVVLYSIWNSQKMFESTGSTYGLPNGILFAEVLLALLPHFASLALYFYIAHQPNPESDASRSKHRKHKSSKARKSKNESVDDGLDEPDSLGQDDYSAGFDTTGDMEKQPLNDQDDYSADEDPLPSSKNANHAANEYGTDVDGAEASADYEYGDQRPQRGDWPAYPLPLAASPTSPISAASYLPDPALYPPAVSYSPASPYSPVSPTYSTLSAPASPRPDARPYTDLAIIPVPTRIAQ